MLNKIIIDTDAKNEIDDQYAIAYAVLSNTFDIRGFTAAHFAKEHSMENSYDEILHVLNLLGKKDEYPVFKGADTALQDIDTPFDSPAARFIISEAMNNSEEHLHVVCIGAITNVASAILMEPQIRDRLKVLWLAGKAWPKGGLFFNNRNDIQAAQIVFCSGVDLTLVPACGTANKLKISLLDRVHIKGRGEIGDYLWSLFMRRFGIPKAIYDVAAIAALKSHEMCRWIHSPRPALMNNGEYDHSSTNGTIHVVVDIDRIAIRNDLFSVLSRAVNPAL